MSKRAEELAKKLYPDESGYDGWSFDPRKKVSHIEERKAFAAGYKQAEKDIKEPLLEWAKNVANLYELPLNGREPSEICLSKAETFRLVINKIKSL